MSAQPSLFALPEPPASPATRFRAGDNDFGPRQAVFWSRLFDAAERSDERDGIAVRAAAGPCFAREIASAGLWLAEGAFRALVPHESLPRLAALLRGPDGRAEAHALLVPTQNPACWAGPTPRALKVRGGVLGAYVAEPLRGRGRAGRVLAAIAACVGEAAAGEPVLLFAEEHMLAACRRRFAVPVLARRNQDRPEAERGTFRDAGRRW